MEPESVCKAGLGLRRVCPRWSCSPRQLLVPVLQNIVHFSSQLVRGWCKQLEINARTPGWVMKSHLGLLCQAQAHPLQPFHCPAPLQRAVCGFHPEDEPSLVKKLCKDRLWECRDLLVDLPKNSRGVLRAEGRGFGPSLGCFCGLDPVSGWRPSRGPWVQPNRARLEPRCWSRFVPKYQKQLFPPVPAADHARPLQESNSLHPTIRIYNFSVILQNIQNVCDQLGSHYQIIYHYSDTAAN